MRFAVCVRTGDDAARGQAHDVEDGIALGAVLGLGFVDQDGIGVVCSVGGDNVGLIARVVET